MTEVAAPTETRAGVRDRAWSRSALALGAGLLIAAAMPPWGWWPLAFAGIALWGWLLDTPGKGRRFWVGVLVAIGWFEPSMLWMVKFSVVGWPVGVAIWFGVLCGLTSVVCPPGRWRYAALTGALIVSEWVRWHAPFGGVPLSMLAMTQGRGPLLPVARVAGSLGVSAAVAACGAGLGLLLERRWRAGLVAAFVVVAVAVAGVFAPAGEVIGTRQVAAVQGGGPQETRAAGTDYHVVFTRHLTASAEIRDPVDLIVWPENVVNVGRFEGSPQAAALSDLARRHDATVVAGIVEDDGPEHFLNAAVAIAPDGTQVDRYDKVRRVPYGEYVPLRFLLDPIAGSLLPARDQVVGRDPNVLEAPTGPLGVVISWEVFFGRRVRTAVNDGAEVMLNPTNGSSYWLTQVQTQQLASSALRAVESGRWMVQAAPTGFTAFVDPAGNVVERIGVSEAGVAQHEVEMRDGLTWAARVGDVPALLLATALLALTARARLRDRKG